MTAPLTPDEIKTMEADALAGTPGDWRVDGPACNQIVWTDNENRLCFMAHSDGLNDERDFANARRIARVPRLEATITAQAVEIGRLRGVLAEYQDSNCEGFCSDVPAGYCNPTMLLNCSGCNARAALEAKQ